MAVKVKRTELLGNQQGHTGMQTSAIAILDMYSTKYKWAIALNKIQFLY